MTPLLQFTVTLESDALANVNSFPEAYVASVPVKVHEPPPSPPPSSPDSPPSREISGVSLDGHATFIPLPAFKFFMQETSQLKVSAKLV